uniref:Uncharacterized protein n=1 Tax=Steinernema glaseri TaxID=37863 RepID=A0A1I7ZNV0_9BILA
MLGEHLNEDGQEAQQEREQEGQEAQQEQELEKEDVLGEDSHAEPEAATMTNTSQKPKVSEEQPSQLSIDDGSQSAEMTKSSPKIPTPSANREKLNDLNLRRRVDDPKYLLETPTVCSPHGTAPRMGQLTVQLAYVTEAEQSVVRRQEEEASMETTVSASSSRIARHKRPSASTEESASAAPLTSKRQKSAKPPATPYQAPLTRNRRRQNPNVSQSEEQSVMIGTLCEQLRLEARGSRAACEALGKLLRILFNSDVTRVPKSC